MSAATITLLFLLFAVVMFVFEKIPLGVTSMIVCIGLVVTGVLDVKTAFAGFIDSNVILFVAMFIVGGALFETGMANKIGGIVTHFAKSERSLIVAIMVIVGLMSGVLSNTGTAAVLIPVVIGIAAKSGYARSKLLMPLVFAAAMGGNLSLIGAPGNLIAQSALGEIGMSFGFFEYAIVGLPILAAGILFYATLGMKLLPNHPVSDDDSFGGEQDFSNVPKWKQVLSLVILVLTLLGMIFEKQIGIKLCITGCIGALALILTGVISEKDALKSIDLKTIFLFGGTLSLASALDKTGAGAEIANIVIGALGKNPSPYVLTLVVFLLCCVMTNFMSNTATTALMVPICLSIAQGMQEDAQAGMIYAFLEDYAGDRVCSKQLYAEALGNTNIPAEWETRAICEIMNTGISRGDIQGWQAHKTAKRYPKYGVQKGWERVTSPETGVEDFSEITDAEAKQLGFPCPVMPPRSISRNAPSGTRKPCWQRCRPSRILPCIWRCT